jgi:hypothetical protein
VTEQKPSNGIADSMAPGPPSSHAPVPAIALPWYIVSTIDGNDESCNRKKSLWDPNVGVWQGVAMNSLKFYSGLPCPALLRPAGGPPLEQPYGRLLPFEHPTPYAYGSEAEMWAGSKVSRRVPWSGRPY